MFGKILFVLSVLATTPWGRFQVMLFLDNGISPAQLGTIQLFAVPFKAGGFIFWGIMADRVGIKSALIGSILLSTLVLELFRHSFLFSSLGLVIGAKILRTSCNGAWPLADSYAVKAGDYGNIRMWGSASWGLSGLTVGVVLDALHSRYGYSSIFGLTYLLASVLLLLILRYFPSNLDVKAYRKSPPALSQMLVPLMNRQLLSFLLVNFCFGVAVSVSTSVVPAWAKTVHRASASTLGLITFCTCFLGLFVFQHAGWLLARYGAKRLLLVAHFGHAVRLLLYGLVTTDNASYALPLIETLHCFSFALFWNASTSILHSLAPDEVLATAQTMLSSTHMSLAQTLGQFFFLNMLESHGFGWICRWGIVATIFSACMTQWLIRVPRELTEVIEIGGKSEGNRA